MIINQYNQSSVRLCEWVSEEQKRGEIMSEIIVKMKSDYISRQAAIDSVWRAIELENSYVMKHRIYTDLKTIPAADVVEVVRCKDCKYKPNGYTDDDVLRYPNFPHEENNPCPCQVYEDEWYSWIPNDDFYCSYGERA